MKKRLTIADYQEANQKLIEERATLTRERDEARKERDDTKNTLLTERDELLELLGGHAGYNGVLSRNRATKVQIARRAGELVANERFFYDLKKEVFGEEIQISGTPVDMGMSPRDMYKVAHEFGGVPKKHVHTIDCLPEQMREGVSKLAETITKDLNDEIRRRKARRRARSLFFKLAVVVVVGLAIGYFGAAAIF